MAYSATVIANSLAEVNREKGVLMALMVFVGVALFYLTERLLSGLGF